MATLSEKLDLWDTGQLSPEGVKKLTSRVMAGSLDAMGQQEGIDMDALRNYMGSKEEVSVVQAPEFMQRAAEAAAPALPEDRAIEAEQVAETGKMISKVPESEEPGFIGLTEDIALENLKKVGFGLKQMGGFEPEQVSGEGFTDVISGAMGLVASPIAAAVQKIPGGESVAEILNKPTEFAGWVYERAAEKAGKDINDPAIQQAKQQIMTAFDLGTFLLPAAGKTKIGQATKAKAGQAISKASDFVAKPTKGVAESAISKATGLSGDTLKTLVDAPDKVKAMQDLTPDIARNHVFTQAKGKIDDAIEQRAGTGAVYEEVRASGQTTGLPSSTIQSWLDDQGLQLADGELKFTNKSKVRSASDVAKLKEVLDLHVLDEAGNIKPNIGADEFLTFRDDLTQLAKFDQTKTNNLMQSAKSLRSKINEDIRPGFEGLQELDASFAAATKELNAIKDLIYKKDGSLKANAISNVNNLLNKGKEVKMEALKQIFPDEASFNQFADDIRAVKAAEDITLAGGNKVGNYFRAGGEAAAIFTGNIPVAVGLILSHPSVITRFLQTYGAAKAKLTNSQIAVLTEKLRTGKKFTAKEAAIVNNIVSNITDEEALSAIVEEDSAAEETSRAE